MTTETLDITLRFTFGHPERWFEPDAGPDFETAMERFLTEHDAFEVLINFVGDGDDVKLVSINKPPDDDAD